MPRINLLPWREGQRKERKLAFTVALGAAALAAGLATFVVYIAFGSMIEGQEARNEKLRGEIKAVDKQIEEINNLETSKQKFIARMTIIEQLQRSRPEIVHVFDEIVKTLPDGGVSNIGFGCIKAALQPVDAALAASVFHSGDIAIADLKRQLRADGVEVRA